jgi:hypothetical protein
MKDFLGSEGKSACSSGGRDESRKRCHEAKGYSHFDASTAEVGNCLGLEANSISSNELGIVMLA